jgi:hypothetical protein
VLCEQSRCAGLGISERWGAETTTKFQSSRPGPGDPVAGTGCHPAANWGTRCPGDIWQCERAGRTVLFGYIESGVGRVRP